MLGFATSREIVDRNNEFQKSFETATTIFDRYYEIIREDIVVELHKLIAKKMLNCKISHQRCKGTVKITSWSEVNCCDLVDAFDIRLVGFGFTVASICEKVLSSRLQYYEQIEKGLEKIRRQVALFVAANKKAQTTETLDMLETVPNALRKNYSACYQHMEERMLPPNIRPIFHIIDRVITYLQHSVHKSGDEIDKLLVNIGPELKTAVKDIVARDTDSNLTVAILACIDHVSDKVTREVEAIYKSLLNPDSDVSFDFTPFPTDITEFKFVSKDD